MEHLNDTAKKWLNLSNTERILKCKEQLWIGYPRALQVLDKLEDVLDHPKSLRMPNMLVIGETNNGKTVLVNRFVSKHKHYIRETDNSLILPVLLIQAPPRPDEKRFYNSLLDNLGAVYKFNDHIDKKQYQVMRLLERMETKVLIVDEFHHILAGTPSAQRVFLNVIKYISNELQISIVGAGIKDAYYAINADPQLGNRFEVASLPSWKPDDDFLRLLASFERLIPLGQPSNLIREELAMKIFTMSDGKLGEISTIIKKAAILAIENGKEYIDTKVLGAIDYIPQSKRKNQLNQVGF
ncbi:TniB family NTP-binding protein [Pedobacter sp. Hv1]|uniref:TniB family NTP-binding protein n=1 Tax=Pedobacter sp. Hv1 TaxID=1740090 RepID=UPI0006D8D703|nr:TniB family NTP-binding protein [Pedobacter sp. Hv1]KQB99195.1 AAA family ATPase [Pedobacter sp. Hv1]